MYGNQDADACSDSSPPYRGVAPRHNSSIVRGGNDENESRVVLIRQLKQLLKPNEGGGVDQLFDQGLVSRTSREIHQTRQIRKYNASDPFPHFGTEAEERARVRKCKVARLGVREL